MPLQNRVTPEGLIVRSEHLGSMMGNRGGQLHDTNQELGHRRWVSRQWISCRLEFNNRKRKVMAPNRYTELFFLDEATAMSAGHRPCFECRRDDAVRFATLWNLALGLPGRATAKAMDDVLHPERVDRAGNKVTWKSAASRLPDGTMVRWRQRPHLVLQGRFLEWSMAGYGEPSIPAMPDPIEVLTPHAMIAVLSTGFCPNLHPTAKIARR